MISFQVNGMEGATLRVERLAHFEADRLLNVLGNLVRSQTVKHFQIEAGPTGAWAARKPGSRQGGQILTNTGRLKGSIQAVIGGGQVEVGTNVFYGKFHQRGTRKMVARPFVGFSAGDENEVRDTVNRFMAQLVR